MKWHMNTEFDKCDKYRHTLIHTLQITCLEIQFKNEITKRLLDFKSVRSKNCAVFRTAWLATDTNCKDGKKVGMMKIQDSLLLLLLSYSMRGPQLDLKVSFEKKFSWLATVQLKGRRALQKICVGTVFENHRKSIVQHCERSELRLYFEWTKVN